MHTIPFEAPEVVDEKDFTAYENTQTYVKVTSSGMQCCYT